MRYRPAVLANSSPKTETTEVAIVGAGPAGLMAAERLAAAGAAVTVFDRMPSAGRKFLMAGRGGLNLAHSEDATRARARYREAASRLAPALDAFPADAIRRWCAELGVETFVGTSGRIFPKELKASPLLRAWLRRLNDGGVTFRMRSAFGGFSDDGALLFDGLDGRFQVRADAAVLALGGASWPRLGANGDWASMLAARGISVAPLRPSNCAFAVNWSPIFAERFAGAPLKRVAMSFAGETARGEAMITRDGIEGGLVYALSAPIREAIASFGEARVSVDLRPDLDPDALTERIAAPRGKRSMSTHLAKAGGLPPVAVALLREAGPPPQDPDALAQRIKAFQLTLVATGGLDRAISTAGGVRLDEVDDDFMLKRLSGVFVAGEMLDWEAPTGGYLLHACFATGRAAGEAAARRLAARSG